MGSPADPDDPAEKADGHSPGPHELPPQVNNGPSPVSTFDWIVDFSKKPLLGASAPETPALTPAATSNAPTDPPTPAAPVGGN